jgi:electron transport complex protein RnfG
VTGKEMAKLTVTLVVIYLAAGILLAMAYGKTSPIIFRIMEEEKQQALKRMMPLHLKMPVSGEAAEKIKAALPEDAVVTEEEGVLDIEADLYDDQMKKLKKVIKKAGVDLKQVEEYSDYSPVKAGDWEPWHKHAEYYDVTKDGERVAYMVESFGKGYSSYIHVLVAVDKDFMVKKINVIGHAETPGLGDEIELAYFKDKYRDKELDKLVVIKGPTEDKIQAITGATISTRAVTNGVKDGLEMLIKKYAGGDVEEQEEEEESHGDSGRSH